MATVYLAEDLKHHRPVALKVLQPEVARVIGPSRFLQEIEIAASLAHPNILPLYDSGDAEGFLYYVMPYFEGETLRSRLTREKQLPLDEAIEIIGDVADGVDYAHKRNIVHRDIKPENILMQGDRAVVADFGIARAISRSAKQPLTSSGIILGTAQYMSPEQALGDDNVGERSDIYSLGCVFYEMLAGEPPYTGPTIQSIVTRHAVADIPSVRVLRPDVPPEVDEIIRSALGKVPAARPATAATFAGSLKTLRGRKAGPRPFSRKKIVMAAAATVVVLVGTLALSNRIFARSLTRNDWVLAADFDGPPNDPTIAPAFRDLVTTALSQSRFVRVIERRQLNEIMRQAGVPETTFVDLELARQLAQRGSIRAVLVGSVRPLGRGYSAVVHVVSAEDGKPLASAAGAAHGQQWGSELVNTAETEVNELRSQLGERRSEITENRPLRDVATPSFDAFRYYSQATDAQLMRGDFEGSNQLLSKAIALDSGFASAWALRASNYLTERQLDSARISFDKALASPQRLGPAEQYRLKGDVAYTIDHDLPAAVRWYDLYLVEMPNSRSGRNNRALYLSALGRYEEAETDLEDAIRLNPFGAALVQPTLLNLAAIQVVLGKNEKARQTSKELTGLFADYMSILLPLAETRWAAADSAALRVLSRPDVQGLFKTNAITAHASALAAQGAVTRADSVLRDAVMSSKGSTARWFERARLLLATSAGEPLGAPALSESDTSIGADNLRALWAARWGDTSFARGKTMRLRNGSARDRAIVGSGPTLVDGWIAMRAGRFGEATRLVGSIATTGEQDPTILDRADSFMQRWLVAEAYQRNGKADSAAHYFALMLQPTGMPPGHYALRGLPYSFANFRLAEIAKTQRDARRERKYRDDLRKTLVHPDPISRSLLARSPT